MHGPTAGRERLVFPTRRFWILTCLLSPIAAGAAAVAGVAAAASGETGVGVALALLAALYAWLLAHEPAVRGMRLGQRIMWVVVGLAISAAVVVTAFVALITGAWSGDGWD